MENHQQGLSVQIEMERLNNEPFAEPVPPQSSRNLKMGIILVSVMGLVAVISTCLLFLFLVRPACVQMDKRPAANTVGKVNITCRPQETKQKGHYEIFKAEEDGKYLIHGWLRRSDDSEDSGDIQLVHWLNAEKRTLQKNNKSGFLVFFGTEVQLCKSSRVHLQFTSQSSTFIDSYFYVNEL